MVSHQVSVTSIRVASDNWSVPKGAALVGRQGP